MSDFIRPSVSTIEAFFLQHRVIQLPWFQRAYAWREDNVLRLVADIKEAMENAKQRYSLGHIYLAGDDGDAMVALVDGHQRAITLAMIFAVLRDIAAGDTTRSSTERTRDQQRLHRLLALRGTGAPQAAARDWRLVTQEPMSHFFERYVQEPGATLVDPDEDPTDLTPAERNLINNRDRLRELLGPARMSPAKRSQFTEFLLTHCWLVIVEVDDEDEAWSMLGIQQTTRLPHDASEQAKIAIIYSMPQADQEAAAHIWETVQSELGNERLGELLVHLRTQRLDKRSTKPLEGELQQLYALNRNGLDFMRTIFRPHAEAMRRVDDRQIGTGMLAGLIHGHIEVLSWLDHRMWMAPVLAWLTANGELHRETEQFFARLDRIAWAMRLAGSDPHEQETRFIRLTHAVRRGSPVDQWPEFDVSPKMTDEVLAILRSRTFYLKHFSKTVLRRVCYQMGHDPGVIDGEKITVEHILPRKPAADSRWLADFGGVAGVKEHADRLGNMALLTKKLNQEAGVQDWTIKRPILEACYKVSGHDFRMTGEAATHAQWTPRIVAARTEKLIAVLFEHWQIALPPA